MYFVYSCNLICVSKIDSTFCRAKIAIHLSLGITQSSQKIGKQNIIIEKLCANQNRHRPTNLYTTSESDVQQNDLKFIFLAFFCKVNDFFNDFSLYTQENLTACK
jgi:hypothetical protein